MNPRFVNNIFRDFFGYDIYPTVTYRVYDVEDVPVANAVNMPAVKQVIFNKEATIVYFADGTKCIVRKSKLDEYNREHAVVYAIVKRAYGVVDPQTGVVDGNGMGNMLAKLVANGYDQEAHVAAEKAKKAAKHKVRFVGDDDHEKHDWENEIVKPWTKTDRDNKGRFVKKSNRNK